MKIRSRKAVPERTRAVSFFRKRFISPLYVRCAIALPPSTLAVIASYSAYFRIELVLLMRSRREFRRIRLRKSSVEALYRKGKFCRNRSSYRNRTLKDIPANRLLAAGIYWIIGPTGGCVRGLMMNSPLLVTSFIDRAAEIFGDVEIVSRRADRSIHRYTYKECAIR